MGTLHGLDAQTANKIAELKMEGIPKKINNSKKLEIGQQWQGMYGKIIYRILDLTPSKALVFIDHGEGNPHNREKWFYRSGAQFYKLLPEDEKIER